MSTETENAASEAAGWQQFYEQWLALIGTDVVTETLNNQCNENMVEGIRCSMAPAWHIAVRWLDDVNKVIEASAPEPVQAMALNATRSACAYIESGQRCSEAG